MESLPAPEAKHRLMEAYAQKYDLRIFVETGTARGDSIQAARAWADEIHSIEISRPVYEDVVFRFSEVIHRDRIHLYCGNSAHILRAVMNAINGRRALYWFDAHCDGVVTPVLPCETPIIEELDLLATFHASGVVLIDDADLFGKENYTSFRWPTVEQLYAHLDWANREVKDNIVRLVR